MGIFIAWVVFSFVVGSIGSDRKIGFWGALILSFILSPLIGLIITVISPSHKDEKYKAALFDIQKKQNEALQELKSVPSTPTKSITQEIAEFADLKDKGIITETEFQEQKKRLLSSI